MVARWIGVGFVHGVMNTDNMSILGLTIDYGPYGWVDNFDPEWTPNTTVAGGRRYRFGHQPRIAHWNLWQLANALYPVIQQVEPLERALTSYADIHESEYRRMMQAKLGFAVWHAGEQADDGLLDTLHRLLERGDRPGDAAGDERADRGRYQQPQATQRQQQKLDRYKL